MFALVLPVKSRGERLGLRRDLALARQSLAPTWFKLVGGEPLLHPELIQCKCSMVVAVLLNAPCMTF